MGETKPTIKVGDKGLFIIKGGATLVYPNGSKEIKEGISKRKRERVERKKSSPLTDARKVKKAGLGCSAKQIANIALPNRFFHLVQLDEGRAGVRKLVALEDALLQKVVEFALRYSENFGGL